MSQRPIRISIHALGGQGGGVLADWIVDAAEGAGWIAQATSVAGVAQRTGSTFYYIELAPPSEREPTMALSPSPGDVDIVVAAELMEAGRAVARGLVTPDRTILIASSHRVFAIAEKSAMGDGIMPSSGVLAAAQASARRLVLADFAAIAEARRSVISAALLGALSGSDALPFPRSAYEAAIRRGGKGVEASLAAFAAAHAVAQGSAPADPSRPEGPDPAVATLGLVEAERPGSAGAGAPTRDEQLFLLPEPARPIARLGVDRLLDYQGRAYADLYLERLTAIAEADRALGGASRAWSLTAAVARHLPLWMSFEDTIRVADLKTRSRRSERIGAEARAPDGGIVHVTEFLHPRFEEICDTLPRRIGARLLASDRARRWFARWFDKGRFVATTKLRGFLLLWSIARLRRFRPRTLRYRIEQQRIDGWLESAVNAARMDYELGVEVIRLQRLVKGYGETHSRGWRNFRRIMDELPRLAERGDGAAVLRRLHDAALKDEEGSALHKEVEAQHGAAAEAMAA